MAYPYRNGGYGSNYGSSNASNSTEKAADKYKNWEYGRLKVTVTPSKPSLVNKEPASVINIYNLEPQDAAAIVDRLSNNPNKKTASVWVDKAAPSHLLMKVYQKDIDEWLDNGDLNSVQSVLYKSGVYDNNEVAHLEDQIASGFQTGDKEANTKLAHEAEESVNEMWKRYLTTVNDPVTMKQLELYRRVYQKMGVYGIMLSIRNVDLIRSRMPDATFVTTKANWESMFGRGIVRGATPLPYLSWITTTKNSSSEFEDAKNETNWDTTNTSDLAAQVVRGIDKIASQNKSGFFKVTVGYDVKDTYLLSGAKEDKFTSQEGLLNNLTGELNQKAKDREASLATANAQQQPISGQDEMTKRTELASKFMADHAQDYGISPKSTGDANNNLADMIYEYCINGASKKAGILNPNNANVYAENATKVTLILTRLATPALQRFNKTYTYDKKEAASLMQIVYGLVKNLEGASKLDEGIGSWLSNKAEFIKRFIAALKQIGCNIVASKGNAQSTESPEMIKENFFRVFNKINGEIF